MRPLATGPTFAAVVLLVIVAGVGGSFADPPPVGRDRPHQLKGRRVGPVQVLEHDDLGLRRRRFGERIDDLAEQPATGPAGGCGVRRLSTPPSVRR